MQTANARRKGLPTLTLEKGLHTVLVLSTSKHATPLSLSVVDKVRGNNVLLGRTSEWTRLQKLWFIDLVTVSKEVSSLILAASIQDSALVSGTPFLLQFRVSKTLLEDVWYALRLLSGVP